MAAAAAALGASGVLGKAAVKAVGVPLNARSGSGNNALCNGEYSDTALPAQHASYHQGLPAAAAGMASAAGSTSWQVDATVGLPIGSHALQGAPSSDISLSGTDCTPRQASQAALGAAGAVLSSLSAAAPLVTSSTSSVANRLSTGYTPRAMETDAPGLAGKQGGFINGTKQLAAGVLAFGPQAGVLPQQQLPGSARDATGQAAMVAALQASMQQAAAGSAPSYISAGNVTWAEQQQQSDMPQTGGMTHRSMMPGVSSSALSSQQQLHAHRQLDGVAGMAIVGQGIGPSSMPGMQQQGLDHYGVPHNLR